MDKDIDTFQRNLARVIRVLNGLAMAVLMAMVLLLVTDVVLRRFFNSPLPWGFEIVKVMLAIVVAITISYCALRGGHISIDLLTSRFPPKTRKVIGIIIYLFSTGLFIFLAWGLSINAVHLWDANRITGVLPIPIFYFVFTLALGSLLLALILLGNLVKMMIGAENE